MGNIACTDAVPFDMVDIFCSAQSSSSLEDLLSVGIRESFSRYQHNIKAFAFHPANKHNEMVTTTMRCKDPSQVKAEPVDLSRPKIKLDETAVYVLIHLQCMPLASSASSCRDVSSNCRDVEKTTTKEPQRKEVDGGAQHKGEETPTWARVLSDVFTPRGVATTFATNIGKPSLFVSPSVTLTNSSKNNSNTSTTAGATGLSELDFRFSIHIFTGIKADQLVASVALLHALRIEQYLMDNDDAVRRLFFNYKPPRKTTSTSTTSSPTKIESLSCVPVGDIVGSHTLIPRTTPLPIVDEYSRNAILRILHHMRCKPSFPAFLAAPSSVRGNVVSRGSTPRGLYSPTSFSTYQPSLLHSLGGAHMSTSQGPPVLEIPRLRFATATASTATTPTPTRRGGGGMAGDAPRQYALDLPTNPAYRSGIQTPQWTQREGYTSTSNGTSMRTPPGSVTSPVFPVVSNLRLNEALNARTTAEVSVETDEVHMTEERMQKLKSASPEATEVLPWLFVGGEEAARDRKQLLFKGITHVVNTVAFSLGNIHDDVFQYLSLYVSDSPDEPIFSLFPIVIRFVEESREKGGKTFIHCHQGVSRSCSFIIAYIMWYQGLCYDRAFEFVRMRRQVCSPNTGFYVNLLLWEGQMAKPTLNRAYAYVPYTEYMFPFSFRLALSFRQRNMKMNRGVDTDADNNNGNNNDNNGSVAAGDDDGGSSKNSSSRSSTSSNDDSHIINQFMQLVHDTDHSYTMDPRLSYGILLETHESTSSISSCFFAGADCDAIIRQDAKEEWDKFIKYNFYHGQKKQSINNKGEAVTYMPLPPLRQPTECLWTVDDVSRVVSENIFYRNMRSRASRSSSCHEGKYPKLILARDSRWDKLLAHEDMVFRFAKHLSDEQRVKITSLNRKRMRDEERKRLCKALPASDKTPRLPPTHAGGENRSHILTVPALANATTTTTTNNNNNNNITNSAIPPLTTMHAKRLLDISSLDPPATSREPIPTTNRARPMLTTDGGMISLPSSWNNKVTPTMMPTAASNTSSSEVEIYMYPFTGAPLTDILDISDMDPNCCYAVLVPAAVAANTATTKSSLLSERHRVFLWFGSSCGVSEADALQEYRRALKVDKDVRLWDETLLRNPVEEVVRDGNEPDELILALE